MFFEKIYNIFNKKLENITFDKHLQISKSEFNKGKYEHGLYHLSYILSINPDNQELLKLLDKYIEQINNVLPDGNIRYYGDEAVRAYLLRKTGELNEAYSILLDISEVKPDCRYLEAWILSWLEESTDITRLDEEIIGRIAVLILKRYPGDYYDFYELCTYDKKLLNRLLLIIQKYHKDSGIVTSYLQNFESILLRKTGNFTEAARVAFLLCEQDKSWTSILTYASALKYTEGIDAAIAFLKNKTDDQSCNEIIYEELIQLYLKQQRWDEVYTACTFLLSKYPEHELALSVSWYCKYKMGQGNHWKAKLGNAGNATAYHYYLKLMPFTGYVPEMHDCITEVIKDIMEKDWNQKPNDKLYLYELPFIESPSNHLLFELNRSKSLIGIKIAFSYEHKISPDPCLPMYHVNYLLWKYDNNIPIKNMQPPDIKISEKIEKLALENYDFNFGWSHARVVAEELGINALNDILATMIYPPAMPDGYKRDLWIMRIQLAATAVIANLENEWETSLGRKALRDIIYGPIDWSLLAAATTLTHLSIIKSDIAPEIMKLLFERLLYLPKNVYPFFEYTLCNNILLIPDKKGHIHQKVYKRLESLRIS